MQCRSRLEMVWMATRSLNGVHAIGTNTLDERHVSVMPKDAARCEFIAFLCKGVGNPHNCSIIHDGSDDVPPVWTATRACPVRLGKQRRIHDPSMINYATHSNASCPLRPKRCGLTSPSVPAPKILLVGCGAVRPQKSHSWHDARHGSPTMRGSCCPILNHGNCLASARGVSEIEIP